MKKLFLSKLFPLLLVLLLSYWTIKPLLLSGFFTMHDDTQVARVFEMAKALSFGQFPVRFVPDLGYGFGYPLFNFYAPLPYYIGAFFNLIGFDVIWATKLMFIIGIILSGFTMYFLGKELAGVLAGICTAILYLYAPYHAVNIYVRGAVGEFYAFAFLPLVILGIVKIIKSFVIASPEQSRGAWQSLAYARWGIIIGALGLSGVLLSHNILGMLTVFFLGIWLIIYLVYLLYSKQKLFTVYCLLFIVFLGLGLSAFFVLPAIVEKNYTKAETLVTGGSDFHHHFVYPDQLWNSPWGFAGSAPGREDGMSFKIGKIHLAIGLLSLLTALISYKTRRLSKQYLFIIYCFLFIVSLSVFLMLELSTPIWEIIPNFAYIQYPWRFLNFTILGLSVMTVFLFLTLKKRLSQFILAFIIIVITILLNGKYFLPQGFINSKVEDYISSIALRYKISKISDEYLPKDFLPITGIGEVAWQSVSSNPLVYVNTLKDTPTVKEYTLYVVTSGELVTNIAFFPGWSANIDGKKINIVNKMGRIQLQLTTGNHRLQLILSNTPIRTLSNIISLLSLFLLVYVYFSYPSLQLFRKKNVAKSV